MESKEKRFLYCLFVNSTAGGVKEMAPRLKRSAAQTFIKCHFRLLYYT